MNKFKIKIKGIMNKEDNGRLEWKDKLKGDVEAITTMLSAELILFTIQHGMSKKEFLAN